MNNIDIRSASDTALFLESLGVVTLGDFWNSITLSGDYWRFYYHDSDGAGVIVKGRKRFFSPHRCYLLPPACNLETVCTNAAEQFFIHAELTNCHAVSADRIIELPENFCDSEISFLRQKVLDGEARTPAVRLAAIALMAKALSAVPPHMLTTARLDRRINTARDYINTRLNEDISLEDLARQCGMSPTAFLRFFKQKCGITPYQYLLQQRYNTAAKLLKDSMLTIDAICDAVGIKDRFHFSRCFKKFFGMPPAAYRNYYKGTVAKL